MESVVESAAAGLGNAVGFLADTGILFGVFAILWVAFAAALVGSQGSLDAAWEWVRALPLVVQAVVWVLFLPVMVGLWVWETTWPVVVRLLIVVGVAGWNLMVFLPRFLQSGRP